MTATRGRATIGVLGPLEITMAGQPLRIGSGKQRTVLARLAVDFGETVTADALVDALWGETPPATAGGTLHTHVSRLRSLLGDPSVITSDAAGYRLDPALVDLDAARFDHEVTAALKDASDRAAVAARLAAALRAWRGPAFGEFANTAFALIEAARLDERRLTALEARLAAELDLGRHEAVVAAAVAAVKENPLREELSRHLILALYRTGRQADALEAYQDLRARLADELGLQPSRELRELEYAILTQDPALDVAAPPPRAIVAASAAHAALVGRSRDIDDVHASVCAHRLVVLIGPGGVGKTSIARAVAGDAPFVDLTSVDADDQVARAVASAMGLPLTSEADGAVEELAARLGDADGVLVLDNCEHVRAGAAEVARAIVHTAPTLRVLATSRERLGLAEERCVLVSPLSTPDAVELFFIRAQQLGIRLPPSDADTVSDICRRLDGIPLAVELAAARTTHLTPVEIDARLEDALALLTTSRRGVRRHETVEAAIRWSYELLGSEDQRAFRALGVFPGSFTPADAEALLGDKGERWRLDAVRSLVERSLVVQDAASSGARLRLLETTRQFAQRRLVAVGELDSVRRRHRDHYVEWVSSFDSTRACLSSVVGAQYVLEFANLRASVIAAIDDDRPDLATRLIARMGALFRHGDGVHFLDSIELVDRVLANTGSADPDDVVACHTAAASSRG